MLYYKMGGGLMQLVAYGAQDIYLTGNPQITFFKVVYRRHTNFSMECIEQTFSGTPQSGGNVTATISRNGDLVYRLYLETTLMDLSQNNAGNAMIDYAELEIGGQQIDKLYGHWMEVWARLTEPNPSRTIVTANASMVGALISAAAGDAQNGSFVRVAPTKYQQMAASGGVMGAVVASNVAVPFPFWFCRHPGLAIPLIALQYHEVKLKIKFSSTMYGSAHGGTPSLWVDYIYLDTDERRRFAQVSHEYLIGQVQHFQATAASTIDLNFNHPVKELIWSGVGAAAGATASAATPTEITAGASFILKLNGHDRFASRPLTYFTRKQVLDYHSGPGGIQAFASNVGKIQDSIAVYSFALKPEEHQPSGTCNFSRIDNAQLTSTGSLASDLNVYAVNYNVLRIMSGMGGLAYSN